MNGVNVSSRQELNRKGVGKTLVFPWRKAGSPPAGGRLLENRGFPKSEIVKRPAERTKKQSASER